MRKMKVCQLAVLALLALAGLARTSLAGDNGCLERTVPVNVLAKDGKPVLGLRTANFRGMFRGKPVEIVSAAYDTGPRRVVVVLDSSGSMLEKWEVELTVARTLVSSAPPQDSFALFTFATRGEDRVDFSRGRRAVTDELVKLETKNWDLRKGTSRRTALYDALEAALDLLQPAQVGDSICLISDGGENASRTRLPGLKSRLLASGVRLFALATDEPVVFGSVEIPAGPEVLRELVETTGGDSRMFGSNKLPSSSYTRKPLQLTSADRRIFSDVALALGGEISQFYRLELKLPQTVDKPRGWSLKVVETGVSRKQDFRVVYPHELAPCK